MDKETYREVNIFSMFGKEIFRQVKVGSKFFEEDVDFETKPYIVQVSKDYYDKEFDIGND
jgi:hypothetical protein